MSRRYQVETKSLIFNYCPRFATGFPIHEEDTESKTFTKDYVSYADPTDNIEVNNSQVFVGVLFPEGIDHTYYQLFDKKHDGATGHTLGLKCGLKNGEKYSYYFGVAWSKYDVKSYVSTKKPLLFSRRRIR